MSGGAEFRIFISSIVACTAAWNCAESTRSSHPLANGEPRNVSRGFIILVPSPAWSQEFWLHPLFPPGPVDFQLPVKYRCLVHQRLREFARRPFDSGFRIHDGWM